MFSNNCLPKICPKFYCEKCDYGTSKKSSYNDHLTSKRHTKSIISNDDLPKICSDYICQNCGKNYKDNSGLWRHKKKCNHTFNSINDITKKEEVETLVKYLMKENSEFKQLIIDQNKQMIELSKNIINK